MAHYHIFQMCKLFMKYIKQNLIYILSWIVITQNEHLFETIVKI